MAPKAMRETTPDVDASFLVFAVDLRLEMKDKSKSGIREQGPSPGLLPRRL